MADSYFLLTAVAIWESLFPSHCCKDVLQMMSPVQNSTAVIAEKFGLTLLERVAPSLIFKPPWTFLGGLGVLLTCEI